MISRQGARGPVAEMFTYLLRSHFGSSPTSWLKWGSPASPGLVLPKTDQSSCAHFLSFLILRLLTGLSNLLLPWIRVEFLGTVCSCLHLQPRRQSRATLSLSGGAQQTSKPLLFITHCHPKCCGLENVGFANHEILGCLYQGLIRPDTFDG